MRSSPSASRAPHSRLVLLLLTIQVILNVASMQRMTPTYDEPVHFLYGQNILNLDSTRFDDSKMPFAALNALPARLATGLGPGPLKATLERLETGRYVTVLFSVLVAVFVFQWARELYGPEAGLLALTLYTFDPNILAHSHLVTTDVYATGMILLSLYFFWRFLALGGWSRATVSALVVGLAQLAKYTSVFLFPLFAMIALGRYWPDLWGIVQARRFRDLIPWLRNGSKVALLFLFVSLIVINVGFLFNRTLTRLEHYRCRSDVCRGIQSRLGPLASLPVPVPYPYLEGLDWVVHRERTGEGRSSVYLLGELRSGRGFNGYYFYASLFKLPIATQLLILAAATAYVLRLRRFEFFKNEWVIVCPIVAFTLYFNFVFRAQIGIRFFLVVFPLLFILCGSLLRDRPLPRLANVGLAGAIAFLVVSALSYYPHFLSYFNELVWDRKHAYRILADSNIDWGQDGWYLEQYRRTHPEALIEPARPTAGTIVVSVNKLTGIGDPEQFRWLRESFQPRERVAYSYLVFQVSAAGSVARDARPADPEDAPAPIDAWVRHCAAPADELGRGAAGGRELAVPRAPTAAAERVGKGRVGRVRQQPSGAVLHPHRGGPKAPRRRAPGIRPAHRRHPQDPRYCCEA